MPDLPRVLASHRGGGYLVSPAGFGKTHLIAEAVALSAKRQLVLTHTYAGVNALRQKMRQLGVSDRSFRIDTIASWALRLALSFPATSDWTIQRPSGGQWTSMYRACAELLDRPFIRRIVCTSYAGLYVDEYQDASNVQHELVLRLMRDLPCRLLGDPLQGIFDFDAAPVDWERDVSSRFECLGQMDTPHRWLLAGRPGIASWLATARRQLEQGDPVDLTKNVTGGVTFKRVSAAANLFKIQANTCRYLACGPQETVIAIHKGTQEYKTKCHTLAKNVAGRFSSIEEIEGKALFSFIRKVQAAPTNQQRLKEVVAFAGQCLTGVTANLPESTKRGEHAEIRQNTRSPKVARAANDYLAEPSCQMLGALLRAIETLDGVEEARADLFNRMTGVLRKQSLHPLLSLEEAAERYHAEFRHRGRTVGRKLIGTTLLIKGLEFDHAIVLDAESLSRKELYVALTRGAKSVTIVSSAPILNPVD